MFRVATVWIRLAVITAVLALAGVGGGWQAAGASTDNSSGDNGKVRIVYRFAEIKLENQGVARSLQKSAVLEQIAGWVNRRITLPHEMNVIVTDKVPPGVTDAVTQPDGRTIYVPPSFLSDVAGASNEIVTTVSRPSVYPADKFNANDLAALTTQFIIGHEFGHALQRQLFLANLAHEEDAADGFASFYSINARQPATELAAALVFDAIARKEGTLTFEGLSSDHPITQQRVFNFLCYLDGSDPKVYDGPLVGSGYLPKSRSPLCPQEWAGLNDGWWTQLKPYLTEAFRRQGTRNQQAARSEVLVQRKLLAEQLDRIRTGH